LLRSLCHGHDGEKEKEKGTERYVPPLPAAAVRRGQLDDAEHKHANKKHQRAPHLHARLLKCFPATQRLRWRRSTAAAVLGFPASAA
jgi:hypothetical protein